MLKKEAVKWLKDKFHTENKYIRIQREIFNIIMMDRDLNPFSRLLMIYLLSFNCNNYNYFVVYPSRKYLAKKFNVTLSTITNSIKFLKEKNYIYVAYSKRASKMYRKNMYILIPYIKVEFVDDYVDFLDNQLDIDQLQLKTKITEFHSNLPKNGPSVG